MASLEAPVTEMDLVQAANRVYEDGFNPDERRAFESGLNNRSLTNFESELLAGASEDWKDEVLSDSSGIDVLPATVLDEFEALSRMKLFVEAYDLLVPIQYWNALHYEIDKSHSPWVINGQYSSSLGLTAYGIDSDATDLIDTLPSTPANVI